MVLHIIYFSTNIVIFETHVSEMKQFMFLTNTGPELAAMVIMAMYTDDACARIAGIYMSYARNNHNITTVNAYKHKH